jgi:beta-lactamase class A
VEPGSRWRHVKTKGVLRPHGRLFTALPRGTVRAVLFFPGVLLLAGCVSIPPSLEISPPDTSLARRTASIAGKTGARFGVSALHVESGRRLDWNAAEAFEGASAIKLALLAEAAARVAESRLDLNDRWTLTEKAVAAGSGWLDEFDPGLMPTYRDLLRLMIAVSDNTAANLFIDRFGADAVNGRMEKLGLPGIRLVGRIPDHDKEPDKWPPLGSMTPHDTAEFLRRAATGTLLGPEPDRLILDILRSQHTKDRLFRLLDGKGNSWAGKSGTYGGVRNDAGILTTAKGRFVLVMFVDRIPEGAATPARLAMGEIAAAIVSAWSATLPDLPKRLKDAVR